MNENPVILPKIQKAKLEILKVIRFHTDQETCKRLSVQMSDLWDYHFAPFLQAEVGDRFAVVKDMGSVFMSGSIILCEKID